MFLGVSDSVIAVSTTGMTRHERLLFAAALKTVREGRFEGSRKAAYTAAKVNSATWARAESGESIKDYNVAKIAANIFPRTMGDWTKLLTEDGSSIHLTYWDVNGLHPDDAGPLERMLGLADDPDAITATDWPSVNKELGRIRLRLEAVEYRIGRIEDALDLPPAISVVQPDRPSAPRFPGEVVFGSLDDEPLAADGDEVSIETEQEEPDAP